MSRKSAVAFVVTVLLLAISTLPVAARTDTRALEISIFDNGEWLSIGELPFNRFLENGSADGKTNLMPLIIDAVNAGATSGEICNMWRRVFSEHKEFVVV